MSVQLQLVSHFFSERTVELFVANYFSPTPPPTSHWETTTCFSICKSQSPLAREILLCERGRTDHRRVPKDNHIFLISLEFNLVAKCNTCFIKKFSQLNSDIQSYRCNDFSLKQVLGLMGGGGGRTPQTLPLDPPLLWCPLIPFLQHLVIRTHQLLATDALSLFISFWRSFRGIFWEALWTLKLTQSQVGIIGFSKNCNSLNRINRCTFFHFFRPFLV